MSVEPIAVDASRIPEFFPFSVRIWRRMDSAGRCPRPYRVGQKKLWNLKELRAWAVWGYPSRHEFERLRAHFGLSYVPLAEWQERENKSGK